MGVIYCVTMLVAVNSYAVFKWMEYSLSILASLMIVVGTVTFDILQTLDIIPHIFQSAVWGIVATLLSFAIILAKRFSFAYGTAERLSEELKGEVEKQTLEINRRSEELEKQNSLIRNQVNVIKTDLTVAGQVMEVMLPSKKLRDDWISLDVFFQPADELAGDLFGQELRNKRLLFWVCDVTGHGVASSMVAGVIRESISACRMQKIFGEDPDPGGALKFISDKVQAAVKGKFYATMNLAVFNYETKELRVAGAAHLMPLLLKKGAKKIKSIPVKNGPLIGSDEAEKIHKNSVITLDEGDLVMLYTDGLNEGMNDKNEEYGKQRIRRFIAKNREDKDLNLSLFNDMVKFQGTDVLHDDVTISTLVVK